MCREQRRPDPGNGFPLEPHEHFPVIPPTPVVVTCPVAMVITMVKITEKGSLRKEGFTGSQFEVLGHYGGEIIAVRAADDIVSMVRNMRVHLSLCVLSRTQRVTWRYPESKWVLPSSVYLIYIILHRLVR